MIKNIFSFGSSVSVNFNFDGSESRPLTLPIQKVKQSPQEEKSQTSNEKLQIFKGDEPVRGTLSLIPGNGKKVDHVGIKLEMFGVIEILYDRGSNYDFSSSIRELDPPGSLDGQKEYSFDFSSVDKQYDSYNGINVRLRYYLRLTILRSYAQNITREQEIWVQSLGMAPEVNNTIKMEVGIEDCLHIEFEYNKSKYHLKDAVVGKVYFLLVRIKIKHMELCIVRRETAGSGSSAYNESETVTRYEIMDGAPVKGESIPVRLFLSGYDLTPTYTNINNKFSVKYFLNLVLVDEEDRRYFKQQEITLWRKNIEA